MKNQGVLLLVGIMRDPVLRYFARFLSEQKVAYYFLDQDALGQTVHFDQETLFLKGHGSFKWFDFSGIYNRALAVPLEGALGLHQLLHFCLDQPGLNVINAPRALASNCSKFYQLDLLSLKVLKKPHSEIRARHQCPQQCPEMAQPWVYKSSSSIRSIVQPVRAQDQKRMVMEPVLFQHQIQGENIRVHVVGGEVFPLWISSPKVDYRYDQNTAYRVDAQWPQSVAQECLALHQAHGFLLSGIDLIHDGQDYYVLEINPAPGFSHFEVHMPGQPISQALYSALRVGL